MSDKGHSDTDHEDDIFQRKPRVARSPPPKSPISDFLNLSKNCGIIDDNIASGGKNNTIQAGQVENRRKSVSFQVPTTSSTFYQPNDNSSFNLLDLETDFVPNESTDFNSFLDPYAGAQATYSDLAGISGVHLSESNIRNRPFQVHSLVFLTQTVCANKNIDCGNALAESSNWKHIFQRELENRTTAVKTVVQNLNTVATIEHEEMAGLSVHSIVRGIDKFGYKTREDVESFISNIELFNDLCDTNNDLKLVVLKTVKSRLKAITLLGNVQALTLEQIIARIRDKFKLSMTFDAAQEKLLSIQQGARESIDSYGERIKKLLDIMNTESSDENVDIQDAKAKMNESLAIRKFKQNILDPNVRMMSLSHTHADLYEAISFANEKLEELQMSNMI